jgi:chemotaxis signal transduction protein
LQQGDKPMNGQANSAAAPNRMGHKINLLVFRLGKTVFGIDKDRVIGIIDSKQLDRSPAAPAFADGLFHYQHQPGLMIRLDKRLELPPTVKDSKLVIIRWDEHLAPIGIVVDSLEGEVALPVDQIQPLPPLIEQKVPLGCIWGVAAWGQGLIMLISLSQVLTDEEKNWLIHGAGISPA